MFLINRIVILLTVIISMIMVDAVALCTSENEIETLKGIKAFNIIVEPLYPGIQKDGITSDQIEKDVKMQLKLAQINISDNMDLPLLHINANIDNQMEMWYIYHVNISVCQDAYLKRNKKIEVYGATTWDIDYLSFTNDLNEIRNTIKAGVDKFIYDYFSVNPKTAK